MLFKTNFITAPSCVSVGIVGICVSYGPNAL